MHNMWILLGVVLTVSGCGFVSDKFSIDPGLDGCVTVYAKRISVGPSSFEDVRYHRVNDKCKDVPSHVINPQPSETP